MGWGSCQMRAARRRTNLARAVLRVGFDARRAFGGGLVPLAVGFFLVPQDLAIELVGQRIDGRVHVGVDALGVDFLAAYMEIGGDLLPELVDGEDDVYVDDVVEMARNAV